MGQMAGILGICSREDCLLELFEGIFCLQPRGQEYCGLATSDGEKIKIRSHRGLVLPTFENDLSGLEGSWGIGHVSSFDRQPWEKHAKFGQFIIGFDGYITNSAALREELFAKGHSFSSLQDIELIATLIGQEQSAEKGLEKMLQAIEGPCSLILLTKDGIYAARDLQGFRPLVLGQGEKGRIVASESCGFPDETTERIRDVEPGEILFINQTGISSLKTLEGKPKKHCSFEWIYYAQPDSVIEGISVTEVRHRLGGFLAQEDNIEADLVGPVPFSGCSHAEGYHIQSELRHLEVFLLPRYVGRTYLRPEVEFRKKEAKRKLTPLKANVVGKRVVLVDDSIRSAITCKGLVRRLKQAGALKVHMRTASPPSIRSCRWDRPPEKEEEFIASSHTPEQIRRFIGADTLEFQKLENVPRAIGLPQDSLCLDCFLP